ncbi:MAG: hypothetical protein OHK0029_31070 [Armatimonadaceae bacterium]
MRKELLKEGQRLPEFMLPMVSGKKYDYGSLAWKRRVLALVWAINPGRGDNSREWLRKAREQQEELRERDITVLMLAAEPDRAPELNDLPEPFVVLRDEGGKVGAELGGAPAFYLIGKDRGIKRAERVYPPLDAVYREIDAMPMRRREMRERG